MKPKTLTIFGSESKLSPDHQEIRTPSGESFFVRITESQVGSYRAISNAKPEEGETLLNSVEVGD